MKYGLPKRTLDRLFHALAHEKAIEKASLFGSRARGDCKYNSDIDIAVYGENIRSGVITRLQEAAGLYTIDVVRISEVDNDLLLANIEADAVVLYEKEQD